MGSVFGIPSNGTHFAFVVDFSLSTSGSQRKAIQSELTKAIEGLEGVNYQVIGFAGPVWFLGDKVNYNGRAKPLSVESGTGRNYKFDWDSLGGYFWKSNEENSNKGIPTANWISASNKRSTLRKLDTILERENWVGGTNWAVALETAMQMNPKADVIYFITDGDHSNKNEMTRGEVSSTYGEMMKKEGS